MAETRVERVESWEFPLTSPANFYIIESGNNLFLIDTGAKPLDGELGSRIRGVVLTHWHWDHTRGITTLSSKTICAGRGTLEMLSSLDRIEESMMRPVYAMGLLESKNIGSMEEMFFRNMLERYRAIVSAMSRNTVYPLEECPLLAEAEIIECPGHTMDHVCIGLEDYVFVGDNVTVGESPTTIHYNAYIETAVRILGCGRRLVAPGHGRILNQREASEYFRNVIARKQKRFVKTVYTIAAERELTFNDLLESVYGVKPAATSYVPARTLIGYLTPLEDAGIVEIDRGSKPWIIRFREGKSATSSSG